MNKQLFDEAITAEMPGEYCLYCGIPLKTEKEKREGFCEDHLYLSPLPGKEGENGKNTGLK